MTRAEKFNRAMNDYEHFKNIPEFGGGVFGVLMNPIFETYFDRGFGYEEIVELSGRVITAIAAEYGRGDLLEMYPHDSDRLGRIIDLQEEHLGTWIGDEGRRAIALSELYCGNISTLAIWAISGERTGERHKRFIEIPYILENRQERLVLPRSAMVEGLVQTTNLGAESFEGVTVVYEVDRVSGDELAMLRRTVSKIGELAMVSVDGWASEVRKGISFYLGAGFSGMRAAGMPSVRDRGVILVGTNTMGGRLSLSEVLMYLGHETDHLDVFRMLLKAGEQIGVSLTLMEYSANLVGLAVGRKVGADQKTLGEWEEDNSIYQRIIGGEGEAAFLTNEWRKRKDWFNRPGLENDFRRLAKVFGKVLGEEI